LWLFHHLLPFLPLAGSQTWLVPLFICGFGSLLMFGSFTKSTRPEGGRLRFVVHYCGKRDGALSFAAEERRRETLVVCWKMIRPCHCGLQKGHKW
jgi:hypothetical protein